MPNHVAKVHGRLEELGYEESIAEALTRLKWAITAMSAGEYLLELFTTARYPHFR